MEVHKPSHRQSLGQELRTEAGDGGWGIRNVSGQSAVRQPHANAISACRYQWQMHEFTQSCTLRSLRSCVLRLQNTHYQHSPVQIYMLAFTEDVFCSNPGQGKAERVHTVLPAPTPQASQHHWMALNLGPTNGSQRACISTVGHNGPTLVPGHGNPGEKPLGKLCS